MAADEFRALGHWLVDRIAEHLHTLPAQAVARDEPPSAVREALGSPRTLPGEGIPAQAALEEVAELLFAHSTFNGHPRFYGYITSSPAPIGMLGDLLAAALNQNTGAYKLSPMATEVEAQTVRWIAELIGFPVDCGGLLVSGGNMANLVCFLAARAANAAATAVYASQETHTWIHKAAGLSGIGEDMIRWLPVDERQRMRPEALRAAIAADRAAGVSPLLVVGTAGSVSTGAVDPLPELAAVCRENGVWFHVDGAYGALAAQVPGVPDELRGLGEADSVAVDPHKWLYAPLEAGCVLVRQAARLRDAFSHHPAYYNFDEGLNYFEYGPQNSRGFRALKVWLGLRQAGRAGYLQMIGDDIALSRRLHERLQAHEEFETLSHSLSITTFRYVPRSLRGQTGPEVEGHLDALNRRLLARLEKSGEVFLSNAVVGEKFALRVCIVNFNTSEEDMDALPELIARYGRDLDR